MISIIEGVTPVRDRIDNIEDVGQWVVELAERAAHLGTFGVGGLILTKSGEVLAATVNTVVKDGCVRDPTGHVERQCVDWLFAEGRESRPADLNEIVIASSLDPCAMCTGAILRAGINVISLAADEQSGVHGASLQPKSIPNSLLFRAAHHMALFGVESHRSSAGANLGALFQGALSLSLYQRAVQAFSNSLNTVRRIVGGNSLPSEAILGGGQYNKAVQNYLGTKPELFLFPLGMTSKDIHDDWPRGLNCFIEDQTGCPILGIRDELSMTPTSSEVVTLIRIYSQLRNVLPDLPHPRWCSIVVREFPEQDDKALYDLGAIGSLMEEKRPQQAKPALRYLRAENDRRPQIILRSLPPLYTSYVGLTIARFVG